MTSQGLKLGPHSIAEAIVPAPMAGVSDLPFRQQCRRFGVRYAVSEMLTSNPELWNSRKSSQRMDFSGESGLLGVQIAGSDPMQMADAARHNADNGAAVIDINMGCPAKKVCKRWAGSALLQDELLVGRILEAVVTAVDVPVTLKIRTGWRTDRVNGLRIAEIAQSAGISMLAVHGRTRDMLYKGAAEYDTIAQIKATVSIPVLANGDIDSPEKAREVLDYTAADGVMIGRGAQGRPWLFAQIREYLATGSYGEPPTSVIRSTMLDHAAGIHAFYGERNGVRIARKHLRWYLERVCRISAPQRRDLLTEESAARQLELAAECFDRYLCAVAA